MKSSTFASLPDSNTTPYYTQSLFLPFEGVQPKVKARPILGGKGAIGKEGKSGFDGKIRDSISGITKEDIRRLTRCVGREKSILAKLAVNLMFQPMTRFF
jgi:hypothetical protein